MSPTSLSSAIPATINTATAAAAQNNSETNTGTPQSLKNVNIQKLKAFFGETTPRIIEGKALSRFQSCSIAKDDSSIDPFTADFKRFDQQQLQQQHQQPENLSTTGRCSSVSSSSFNPTDWALEKMSRSRRSGGAWGPLVRSGQQQQQDYQSPSGRVNKKGNSSYSPKQCQKEHKTWKGKMVQTLKRYGSGTTPSDSTSSEEYVGAMGVPLEHCISSFANEYVPLIVETCTRIVEEKGLESVGVYRVPGNSGAVNALIEELNKDPDGLCLENEKWQDVNLVSSLLKLFFRKLPDSLITDGEF
ncbi:hypothetical protein HELRODRAFT_105840 [Helobdella robusta]|uniref:Rho-GAP domain-containing protein n=1 Tax=Helobdella robusta TaxID=6412 RepID=T1EDX8_HELRO|nr:hypothetical protein HELRODRAFT_105840 [Helobdella robusta]ESO05826.1 hypothetical protein HELRODRAFT_105840 [Helobdella robusta]